MEDPDHVHAWVPSFVAGWDAECETCEASVEISDEYARARADLERAAVELVAAPADDAVAAEIFRPVAETFARLHAAHLAQYQQPHHPSDDR